MSSSTDCCTGPSPGFGHDGSHTLLASNVHAEPAEPIEKTIAKAKTRFCSGKIVYSWEICSKLRYSIRSYVRILLFAATVLSPAVS